MIRVYPYTGLDFFPNVCVYLSISALFHYRHCKSVISVLTTMCTSLLEFLALVLGKSMISFEFLIFLFAYASHDHVSTKKPVKSVAIKLK